MTMRSGPSRISKSSPTGEFHAVRIILARLFLLFLAGKKTRNAAFCCRAAHFFLSQGYKRGDVLALFMENRQVKLSTRLS
jgi:hypothetical protein